MAKNNDNESLKFGSRMALLAIAEIVILAIFKGFAGYFTGMLILVADALSSGADLLTLFASYVGLKISQRPADRNFKYGYYKAETFAAFVTSVIIIYFGLEIFFESVERIQVLEPSHDQILGLISVGVSSIVSFHLFSFLQKAGKKINSLALIDTGKEKKMDILMQVAVLIGIGANYWQIPYLEGIIGMVISAMTLKVGFATAKESLFFLLDYFDDAALITRVKTIISAKSRIVKKIHDIRMRRSGTFIFGEAFLEINPFAQTKDLRNELHNLREKIKAENRYLKDFLLFVDIHKPAVIKVAVPVKSDDGLASELAHTFGETGAYIFVEVKKSEITGHYSMPFSYRENDFSGIIKFLLDEKANVVIDNDMHSLLYYQLRRLNNIEIYPNFSNVLNVENTVKLLLIDT
jgi:cation diffusion facilitator family transporter